MSDNIKTIANDSCVDLIEYTPPFSTLCSIGKRPFWGVLDITYRPGDTLLEFESFEDWLNGLATEAMTVEDMARRVFDVLSKALGDIPLRVTARARTTVHAPVSATIERGMT